MEVALYDCKLETLSDGGDSLNVSIYEPDDVKDVNTIIVVLNGSGLQFFSSLNNYKEPYTLATDLCNYGTHKFPYTCKIYKSNPRFWTKDLLESSRFSRYKYAYHGWPASIEWSNDPYNITVSLTDPDFSAPDTLNQNGIDFTNVDGIFGDELTGSYKYRKITATKCHYGGTFECEAKKSEATISGLVKLRDPRDYGNSMCDFIITIIDENGNRIVDEKTGEYKIVKYIGCIGGKYEWTVTGLSYDSVIHDGVAKRGSEIFDIITSNFEYPCELSNLYEWVDIPDSGDPSKYDFVGIKVFDYDYWNAHRSEHHLFTPWEYLIYSEYDYYDINSPSSDIMIKMFTQKSTFEYTEYGYNESKKLMKFYNGSYKPSYSVPIVCSGKLDPNNSYSTTLYVNDVPSSTYKHEKTMTFLFSSNIELFKEE